MKRFLTIAILALALPLGGCIIHIPNLFGGPDLVLTGNVQNDAASWTAFSASVRAGIAADEAKAKAFLIANCPVVTNASVQVATTPAQSISDATAGIITVTAAQRQINNVQSALSVALNACNAGTASSWVTVIQNVKAAFDTISGWVRKV